MYLTKAQLSLLFTLIISTFSLLFQFILSLLFCERALECLLKQILYLIHLWQECLLVKLDKNKLQLFTNYMVLICSGLSFTFVSGVNILLTGDSGCGKSSLLRVINGIWPEVRG